MGFGPSLPSPQAAPVLPPAAHVPNLGSLSVQESGSMGSKNAAAAEGLGSNGTIATSPEGDPLKSTNTAKATLLG